MTDPHFDPSEPKDDIERFRDAVQEWIRVVTGVDDVYFHTDPAADGMINPVQQCRFRLTFLSSVDVGMDEIRRQFDETSELQGVAQVGIRLCTVQIVAESFQHRLSAHTLMERIRRAAQGVRLSHARELRTQNVSVNEMGTVIHLPTSYDNRVISAATSDFVFNVAVVTPTRPETWIEEVDMEGDLS
jgi:hypothetical protein